MDKIDFYNRQPINLDTFKKSSSDMIATSDKAYNDKYAVQSKRVRKYTEEEIKHIVEDGNLFEQIKLSNDYFTKSGVYRRIIITLATLLKYQGILIPQQDGKKKLNSKELRSIYEKAMGFIEQINLPVLCTNFSQKALLNGTYYGIIQNVDQTSFTTLDLPIQYCSTRYKDSQNNQIIEFDVSYFNTLHDETLKRAALNTYPKEIVSAYRRYQKAPSLETRYYRIPSSIGICFPFFDGRPTFLSAISATADYEEYRSIEKARDLDEIKKIIIQKIPHLNDGRLLFEPEEAEVIHSGTVGMMKGNKNVDILTTYADVDVSQSDLNGQSGRDVLGKTSSAIYTEAGISEELFASTGNLALTKSINNQISFMMYLANQYSLFFTNLINRLYSNNDISFKYTFLPISYYNDTEFLTNAQKLATTGYSLIIPSLAMGISQKDLLNIKVLENDVLNLVKKLIPLATSYTQSGQQTGQTEKKPVGGQEKADEIKSDKTISNQNAE